MERAGKKLIILYVLNILKALSSAENPVSQTAICNYLNDIRIKCDRKTVGRNIGYLIKFGYPIKSVYRKGCYLDHVEMEKIKEKKRFVI